MNTPKRGPTQPTRFSKFAEFRSRGRDTTERWRVVGGNRVQSFESCPLATGSKRNSEHVEMRVSCSPPAVGYNTMKPLKFKRGVAVFRVFKVTPARGSVRNFEYFEMRVDFNSFQSFQSCSPAMGRAQHYQTFEFDRKARHLQSLRS